MKVCSFLRLRRALLLFSVVSAFAPASAISLWSLVPVSGYRNNSNGSLNNAGSNGYVWLSSANSQNNAYNLNFNSSAVNPQNNNNRANGYSVRPVQAFMGGTEGFSIYTIMKLGKSMLDALLMQAYLDARQNERNKNAALAYELDLESNFRTLRESLWNKTYRPDPPMCFIIDTPREVFASRFQDRIVSHLLFNMLAPLFEPLFIYDSYSCRKGKGTLFGVKRLEKHLRSCTHNYTKRAYVLYLDISGYFMSINKGVLYNIICTEMQKHAEKWGKEIDYKFVDYLLRAIIFRDPTEGCIRIGDTKKWEKLPRHKSLFYSQVGCGLTIGDVTSQLFSNIYLNPLDHFIKRDLKCRYYGRYVDDKRIVSESKKELVRVAVAVDSFLKNRLGLHLNHKKTKIVRADKTVCFLGIEMREGKMYAADESIRKFASKAYVGQNLSVLNSYLGYLKLFRTEKSCKRITLSLLESGVYIENSNNNSLILNSNLV